MFDRLRRRAWMWLATAAAAGAVDALLATLANERSTYDLAAKSSYATKAAQRSLQSQYAALAQKGQVPSIDDVGYRIFSQFDEDGILVFIFAVLGAEEKSLVDIGAGNGIVSNCANLAINFGWHGLLIDGDPTNVARGHQFYDEHPDTALYPPTFVEATVTRANVSQVVTGAGYTGEVDFLSIDIDGNDYWIWDALTCIEPRVVCIETHVEFGLRNIVVPYDEAYSYPGIHPDYHGASPVAMAHLAKRKGYRLVGANLYGFNTYYVRKDLAPTLIPEVSAEHVLRHPRNVERSRRFDAVKGMPYEVAEIAAPDDTEG